MSDLTAVFVAIALLAFNAFFVGAEFALVSARRTQIEPRDEVSSTFTREEVAALVEESRGEGLLEDSEYDRLSGALGFTERTVESVLLPLDSLTTLPQGATPAEVEDLCAATVFSRFPVVDDDGEPVGYLHIKLSLIHI